ncbi:MAG: ABC transporter substrate-binding protein [Campylobacteraceae bacterium]
MKKILFCCFLVFSQVFLFANESISLNNQKKIIDSEGYEVFLPKDVKAIADLWHANNQIVLVLGGADKLVVTTKMIQDNPWFSKFFPEIKNITAAAQSDGIQFEELVAAKPDVVITSSSKYAEQLRRFGLNVVNIMFRNYADMKTTIKITGEIIGEEGSKRADDFIKYFDTNIEKVTNITKNIKDEDKPRVMHISSSINLLKVDGGNSIIDEWITLAGGKNAVKLEGNMREITAEELLLANPDIIIVGSRNNEEGIKRIYADPIFSSLNAVKNKKVFGNPSGVFNWDRYSSEQALQILWAAKTIQPKLFNHIDIKEETKEFYKRWLDYDLSDDEFGYMLKGLSPDGK